MDLSRLVCGTFHTVTENFSAISFETLPALIELLQALDVRFSLYGGNDGQSRADDRGHAGSRGQTNRRCANCTPPTNAATVLTLLNPVPNWVALMPRLPAVNRVSPAFLGRLCLFSTTRGAG